MKPIARSFHVLKITSDGKSSTFSYSVITKDGIICLGLPSTPKRHLDMLEERVKKCRSTSDFPKSISKSLGGDIAVSCLAAHGTCSHLENSESK